MTNGGILLNKLELLEQEAYDNSVKVHNFYLGEENLKGLYMDGNVAINTSVNNSTERACVLAEELGHHYTTSGNILDLSQAENRKQERRAGIWAYNKQIGLKGLINAYEHGCRNRHEIAEYLEVTELFLLEAVNYYKEKHGIYAEIDNYIIYFEPLGILSLKEIA